MVLVSPKVPVALVGDAGARVLLKQQSDGPPNAPNDGRAPTVRKSGTRFGAERTHTVGESTRIATKSMTLDL